MTISRSFRFQIITMLGSIVLSGGTFAEVYVCDNDQCSTWKKISATQFATQSTDEQKISIREALSKSENDSIKNGINSVSNTDLYLKNVLWHIGGIEPFKGVQHVTAYIYKSTEPDVRIKTCHVFSTTKTLYGPYYTTCM